MPVASVDIQAKLQGILDSSIPCRLSFRTEPTEPSIHIRAFSPAPRMPDSDLDCIRSVATMQVLRAAGEGQGRADDEEACQTTPGFRALLIRASLDASWACWGAMGGLSALAIPPPIRNDTFLRLTPSRAPTAGWSAGFPGHSNKESRRLRLGVKRVTLDRRRYHSSRQGANEPASRNRLPPRRHPFAVRGRAS